MKKVVEELKKKKLKGDTDILKLESQNLSLYHEREIIYELCISLPINTIIQ